MNEISLVRGQGAPYHIEAFRQEFLAWDDDPDGGKGMARRLVSLTGARAIGTLAPASNVGSAVADNGPMNVAARKLAEVLQPREDGRYLIPPFESQDMKQDPYNTLDTVSWLTGTGLQVYRYDVASGGEDVFPAGLLAEEDVLLGAAFVSEGIALRLDLATLEAAQPEGKQA